MSRHRRSHRRKRVNRSSRLLREIAAHLRNQGKLFSSGIRCLYHNRLPVFARPIAWGKYILLLLHRVAIVPSPKGLTPFWLINFYFHVRVAISNQLDLIALFCQNFKLLLSARSSYLLVICRKRLTSVGEPSRFASCDVFRRSHSRRGRQSCWQSQLHHRARIFRP